MPSEHTRTIDRFFLTSVLLLTGLGFILFLSASLGLLAQDGADFSKVAIKQGVSLLIGIAAFIFFSRFKYQKLRTYSFYILCTSIILNLLLFIPGLAFEHGGAARWIDLGLITIQPSEFLKFACVIYFAAWLHGAKDRITTYAHGLFPYLVIMATLAFVLLAQTDTDTLVIISLTGLIMFVIVGMPLRHFMIVIGLMIIGLLVVVSLRPYALERVRTFFDRSADEQGAGYQINQSLIAIGSGQLFGRGFGQSVQKFGYLPEPIGDSIFAVVSEEFGFTGSIVLIGLYVMLAINIFRIGSRAPDVFSSILVIGIGILITIESFMNMAAMLGIIPLSGLPLLFVSHGGTALILVLAASGIVANVSKYRSV